MLEANLHYVNTTSVYAVTIILPILCTIGVASRFLSRKHRKLDYGADDWMSIVALILTWMCTAVLIYGAAKHIIRWHPPSLVSSAEDSPALIAAFENELDLLAIIQWTFILTSVLAIGAVRLIFALLYRRIFHEQVPGIHKTINLIIIVAIVIWTIAFFLGNLFECRTDFSAMWTPTGNFSQSCPDAFNIGLAMAVTDVAIDLALLVTPMFSLWKLKMKRFEKALLAGMFALGIFSIAAGLTRLVILAETSPFDSSKMTSFGLASAADPIGVVSVGLWWTYMEIGVGLFVAQLPVASRFLHTKLRGPFNSSMARISLTSIWTSKLTPTPSRDSSLTEPGNNQYRTMEEGKSQCRAGQRDVDSE